MTRRDIRRPWSHARLGGFESGREDVRVSAASAGIARGRVFDFVSRRRRIALERRCDRHHHPRRAEAALLRVLFDECGLHWMHVRRRAESFDGRDLVTARVDRQHHARGDGFAVEMHGACAARAAIADELGAGQSKMLAQRTQQRHARLDLERRGLAVDIEFDRRGVGPELFDDARWQRLLISGCGPTCTKPCRCRNCAGALDKRSAADGVRLARFAIVAIHLEVASAVSRAGSEVMRIAIARPKRIIPTGSANIAILIE